MIKSAPTFNQGKVTAVLIANGLLRVANSAGGALIGFYLANLAAQGRAVDAALVGALGVVANSAELAGAVPSGVLADRISPRSLLVISAMGIYSLLLGLGNVLGAALGGILARHWFVNGLIIGTLLLVIPALFSLRILLPNQYIESKETNEQRPYTGY